MRIALLLVVTSAACAATPAPRSPKPYEAELLEQLIAATPPDDPTAPDLRFRLAMDLDQQHAPRALATFRALVDDPRWTRYPRRDEVLFWFAHALGHGPEHDAVLAQLIETYPGSKMRDAALVSLGDAQFELKELSAALATYRLVTSPSLRAYAHYKIAWIDHELGDDPHAREELAAVIAASDGVKTRALRDAATRDRAQWTSVDPTYARADALYAQHDFCAAAPLYAQVAQVPSPDQIEAAYADVLSTRSCEHLDAAEPPGSGSGGDDSRDSRVIPASWQRLLDATDRYVRLVPEGPEVSNVRFLRARIDYGFGHLDQAADDFREVVRRSRDDDEATYAATLLLDCDQRDHRGDLADDLRIVCALPIAKTGELAAVCAAR